MNPVLNTSLISRKQFESILFNRFGLKYETEKRINEYQSYWPNRSVRVVPNKKYKSKN